MKTLAIALALLVGVSVWSDDTVARPGGGHGGGILDHLEYIADDLGLTTEQEQQITEIINAAELATAVDRERMGQIRDALRDLTSSADLGQAQILADELGEIAARLAYNRFETRSQVNAVFTDEQLAMLEEMRAEREAMRESFSRGGFGGGSQRGIYGGQPTTE